MNLKDKIKIFIFPKIISLLFQLGFSFKRLGRISIFARSNMLAQAKIIGRFKTDVNLDPKNIYVLLMLSGSYFHLFVEALIALGLQKKGHNITFVIDDNVLPIHELKRINNEKNWDQKSIKDYVFASKFLNNLGLDFIAISELIKNPDQLKYDEKFNPILEATMLKHYKVGVISKELPNYHQKTELVKKSISITEAIGDKIVELNPDLVLMSHGIYSTWGPPFRVLNDNGIDVLVHGRGKKRHSQVFNWNKTGDSWDVSKEWEKVKDRDLSDYEKKTINDYLSSRISHKDDVYVYNFGSETSIQETQEYLGLDKNKQTFTLFTNVLWDAASAQREIAFSDPVEWVIETIEWFNNHPDKQLIVKIHPAEIVIGTNMPFYNIILDRISPAQNVKIIKPEAKVNSWSIYEVTDLGIVHTTTAGMEMPLVNIPCMVVSQTHYRNKGFTIDVKSKKEYFNFIHSFEPSTIDNDRNKHNALKYAYLLFIRYQIPFNMFDEELSSEIRSFKYNQLQEYFNDRSYDNIINRIINRQDIFINISDEKI